jgi:hypothetical protein
MKSAGVAVKTSVSGGVGERPPLTKVVGQLFAGATLAGRSGR